MGRYKRIVVLIIAAMILTSTSVSADESPVTSVVEHYNENGMLEYVYYYESDILVAMDVYDSHGFIGKVTYDNENIYVEIEDEPNYKMTKISESEVVDENGEIVFQIIDSELDTKNLLLSKTYSTPKSPHPNGWEYYWLYEKTTRFKSPSAQEKVVKITAAAILGAFPGWVGKIAAIVTYLVDIRGALKETDPVYVETEYFQSYKTWICFRSRYYKNYYGDGHLTTEISPIYHY